MNSPRNLNRHFSGYIPALRKGHAVLPWQVMSILQGISCLCQWRSHHCSWQSLYTAFSILCCSSLLFSQVFRVYQKELSTCCGLGDKVSKNIYLNPWSPICGAVWGVMEALGSTLLWVGFETLQPNATSCWLSLFPVVLKVSQQTSWSSSLLSSLSYHKLSLWDCKSK